MAARLVFLLTVLLTLNGCNAESEEDDNRSTGLALNEVVPPPAATSEAKPPEVYGQPSTFLGSPDDIALENNLQVADAVVVMTAQAVELIPDGRFPNGEEETMWKVSAEILEVVGKGSQQLSDSTTTAFLSLTRDEIASGQTFLAVLRDVSRPDQTTEWFIEQWRALDDGVVSESLKETVLNNVK